MTRIAVLKFLICSLISVSSTAQDLHFSQFWMTSVVQNPAMAGANYGMQGFVNYRDQWRSVASPYRTYDASFDLRINEKGEKGFFAAGLNFFNDKAGDGQLKSTQGSVSLAYHVKSGDRSTIAGGLMGGFGQQSIDYSGLIWGNQFDGSAFNTALPSGEPQGLVKNTYADVGAGVVWTYSKGEGYISGNDQLKANVGVAVFHFNRPEFSLNDMNDRLDPKLVIHGNSTIGIKNSNYAFVPGVLYYRQGNAQELLAGAMLRYTLKEQSKHTGYVKGAAMSLGLHYRNQDAMIASMLIELDRYSFGISYDVNVSGLDVASDGKGGLEVSIGFINSGSFSNRRKGY